jgi:hypothetical protein
MLINDVTEFLTEVLATQKEGPPKLEPQAEYKSIDYHYQ